MAKAIYIAADLDSEVEAPSGYYRPLEEGYVDYRGRRLLYTLGIACIEASCCGVGDWQYARVEGYLAQGDSSGARSGVVGREIDTVEEETERTAIAELLAEKHPGVRAEFR